MAKKCEACFLVLSLMILTAAGPAGGAALTLPQTGQWQCYDTSGSERPCSGTGEDGEIRAGSPWPEQRFTVSGECIVDNLTGLTWNGNANSFGLRTWTEALGDAGNLDLCGYTDWRLPNVNEFGSLIHGGFFEESCGGYSCSSVSQWLQSSGFTNVDSQYLSSTSFVGNASIWFADLYGGLLLYYGGKNDSYPVWPVRGTSTTLGKSGQTTSYAVGDDGALQMGVSWPDPRFSASGDCVTDNLTGLVWAKDANIFGVRTWQQALDDTASLELCGENDWRLPNRNELISLVDYSRYSLALPADHPFTFSGVTDNHRYWSSTSSGTLTRAIIVSFVYGYFDAELKSASLYVWPVRGGVGGCPGLTVRIKETYQGFDTVGAAYSAAEADQTIEMQADTLAENLTMAENKSVALVGGYDCGFATRSGYTTIQGDMEIGRGSVEADRLIIR